MYFSLLGNFPIIGVFPLQGNYLYQRFFKGLEPPGYQADQWPPFCAQVKTVYGAVTSLPHKFSWSVQEDLTFAPEFLIL